MARLKVRLHGKVVYDVQLHTHRTYIAGRKEDCDIVLENEKGISREHFKISYQNEKWHLEVLSRYGELTSDGEKVQALELEGHRLFFLPPYEFEYSEMSTALVAVGARGQAAPAVTDSADSAPYEENERTFVGATDSVPHIKVMNDLGDIIEMFKLENGDFWVAGRDTSCDIVIRDQRVSRRQFEIRRQGSQYLIMDLGSVNGTSVNNALISAAEPTVLKSGDAISVLDNQLHFELHDPLFQSRLELVKSMPQAAYLPSAQELVPPPAQYYAPHAGPNSYMPPPPVANKKFDFEKHRPKLIIGAVLLLVGAYFLSDQGGGQKSAAPANAQGPLRPQDAFAHLKPEQQILVKQTYQLAKNLYMQGKYELAKSEITKVYELVPDYEDVKELERMCNEAIAIIVEQRRVDDIAKAKAEQEQKILKQVAECKTKLNSNYTSAQLEECLSPVLEFNPDHPAIQDLRAQVSKLEADKQMRDAQRAEHQSEVRKLQGLYKKAESTNDGNHPLVTLKEFTTVANSSLPDPDDLKGQARRQIASIQASVKQKTDQFRQDADKAYSEQRLRDAILSLRKASDLDPSNEDIKDKINNYVLELKKQMIVLYQEGVLEESYGNVEGSDSKPGAKEKWKKIMTLDIPDGEYYGKAKIKLKKYGAL